MTSEIYLDNAAATPIDPQIFDFYIRSLQKDYYNTSAKYKSALILKQKVEKEIKKIAKLLNCQSSEITFTSGGSESNNLAIFGFCEGNNQHGKHIITSQIEHKSILLPLKKLEKKGFKITYLPVDKKGFISEEDFQKAIQKDTIMASIIYANNEIGSIQNISKFGQICRKNNIFFHSDACQAANFLSLDLKKLNLDSITLNSSKIYGPKGVGLLYCSDKFKLSKQIIGGDQQNYRAGTKNAPGILAFSKALQLAQKIKDQEKLRLTKLSNFFKEELQKISPSISFNSAPENSLPNIINLNFPFLKNHDLIFHLGKENIQISSGSACNSDQIHSDVLTSIGVSKKLQQFSVRFSLGKLTKKKDLEKVILALKRIKSKIEPE